MTASAARLLIACCVLALLRIGYVTLGSAEVLHMEDYDIAQSLVHGDGFTQSLTSGPTAVKAPLYPLFLASILYVAPVGGLLFAALLQHLLLSFAPYVVYKALNGWVDEKAAILSAWILLCHPSYWVYPNTLEATNLFVPGAIACLWFVRTRLEAQRSAPVDMHDALCAAALAALCLVQPVVLPFVLAALFVIIRRRKHGFLLVLVALVVWTPWTLRNERQFQRVIPFKSPVWMNVYEGFGVQSHGLPSLALVDSATTQRIDSLRRVQSDVEMETEYKQVCIRILQDHPMQYLKKCVVQVWRYWSFPPRYRESMWSFSFLGGRVVPEMLLSLACVLGILWRPIRQQRIVQWIVVALIYVTLVYALTQTQNIRFKLDVEWLECIVLGLILSEWLAEGRKNHEALKDRNLDKESSPSYF